MASGTIYIQPDYSNRNVEGATYFYDDIADITAYYYRWTEDDFENLKTRHYCSVGSNDYDVCTYWLTFTLKKGYKLTNAYSCNSSGANVINCNIRQNDDGTYYVQMSNGAYSGQNRYYWFEWEEELVPNTLNFNLENCSCDYSGTTIEKDTEYTFTLTANEFCYFDSNNIPYLSFNEEKLYFTLNEDLTIATLTFTCETEDTEYTINGIAVNTSNTVNFDLTNCNIEPNETIVEQGSIVDYKITTVNSGNYPTYFNEEIPYIEVDGIKTDFKLNEDLTEATLTVEFDSGKTYNIIAKANRKKCEVIVDSDNCYFEDGTTFTESGTTEAGKTIYIFVRANEDYYFTNEESIGLTPIIYDTKTGETLATITLSERTTINGTYYYKYGSYGYTVSTDITVFCHAVNPDDFVYVSCTEDLTNLFSHSHATTFLKGSRTTIEVYVPSGYTSVFVMNEAPEIRFNNGNVLYFDVDEDRLNASITFTVEDDFIIYGHAEAPKVYHNVIAENLTHCKLTSADTFEENEYYTLELTADDGYVFNDSIECTYNTLTTYIDTFYEDDTIARHTFIPTLWSDIIVVEAVAIRQAEQVSNFVHLYKVTNSILNNLAKVRFYDVSSESAEIVDYGEYITNLMEIPFSLPDDIIGDNANIQLGTFDSGVQAPTLLYHDIEVDIGTISVLPKYDNVYDYKETEAILHLPYADDISVPLEYVMNEELHIMYKMDLYTGDVTIILTSTYTGEIVSTTVTNIATQIPFIQYSTDSVMNKLDKLNDNGLRNAFIEIKRNIPYNVFCEFGKPTIDYGKLEDYKGYVEVSDCNINIACTKNEQDLISSILKTGIIIK